MPSSAEDFWRTMIASRPNPYRWACAKHDHDEDATGPTTSWRDAVQLWLQWNSMYEQVTEGLYQNLQDHRRLEDLMDQMDRIRRRAVGGSRDLLRSYVMEPPLGRFRGPDG